MHGLRVACRSSLHSSCQAKARAERSDIRVPVVEDVRRLADDIAEGLRDQRIAVDVAYDGLEAIAKLDVFSYDVVILDRNLPGLHCDIVCRMITESEKPAMALMLTAASAPGTGLQISAPEPTII